MPGSLSSPLAVAGIIAIVLGLILAISGLISLIANPSQPGAWFVWVLLTSGLVLGVAGGVMLAVALNQSCAVIPTPVLNITTGQSIVTPAASQMPVTVYTEPSYVSVAKSPVGLNLEVQPTPVVGTATQVETPVVGTVAQVGQQVSSVPLTTEGKSPVSNTLQVGSFGAPRVNYQ